MPDDYPVSVRLPLEIRDKIKQIAKSRKTTASQIIIEACIRYIDDNEPGTCRSCHTQNPPDAHYCLKCGEPITSAEVQTLQNRITELEETLDARVKTLVKEVIEGADWIDQNLDLIKKKMEKE